MAEACVLCESSAGVRWRQDGWVQCAACRTLLREPMPSERELAALYERSWQTPGDCRSETGGTDERLARLYGRRLCQSLGRDDLAGLAVLDFGAGRGEMLEALTELGAQVTAVEPFGWRLLREHGYQAYEKVEDLPGDLRVDGVVSMDVIEHMLSPWRELALLGGHLKPGGWMCLCTPNGQSLRARLGRSRWGECQRAGHLMLFGPRGMQRLLERAGFSRHQRLRWYIPYSANAVRNVGHWALHALGVDGELRYMAWRGDSCVY